MGERHDIDALAQERFGKTGRECGVTEHHRDDGVKSRVDREARGRDARSEMLGVLHNTSASPRFALKHVKHSKGGPDNDRREAVRDR